MAESEAILAAKTGDELLISLVEGYRHLWDKKHRDYKNHEMKEISWVEIASGTNSTVADCQNRWKRLREYYFKERQKIEKETRSGSEQPNRKPWPLFPFLSFLESSMHRIRTFTNFTSKRKMNCNEESLDAFEFENYSKDIIEDLTNETNVSNSDTFNSEFLFPPPSKKGKLTLSSSLDPSHQYCKNTSKIKDQSAEMMNIFKQASSSVQLITEKLTQKEESRDQAICNMILKELQQQKTEEKRKKKLFNKWTRLHCPLAKRDTAYKTCQGKNIQLTILCIQGSEEKHTRIYYMRDEYDHLPLVY